MHIIFQHEICQSDILPEVATDMLDVSSLPDFDSKYINSGQIASYYADDYSTSQVTRNSHRPGNFQSMEVFLSSLLPPRYNGYFKAFYLNDGGGYVDITNIVQGLNGYSSGDNVVLFPTKNDETAAHEFLHSLDLPHTFVNVEAAPNAKFTFEIQKTDNVMDYSHQVNIQRTNLWHWQWKVAHAAAENE